MPITYGTSHLALVHRARLAAGQTLLVLGASGGVGTTAVQVGVLWEAGGGVKLAESSMLVLEASGSWIWAQVVLLSPAVCTVLAEAVQRCGRVAGQVKGQGTHLRLYRVTCNPSTPPVSPSDHTTLHPPANHHVY